MPFLNRRFTLSTLLASLLGAVVAVPAHAQEGAPAKIIVGFPAGTGPDIVARLVAQKLSEGWNNMGVIVDNKPGAGGLIAASEAARATPDGVTP